VTAARTTARPQRYPRRRMAATEILYVAQIDPARREELLETFSGDPPYDIAATGLERHTVFIGPRHVAFLFEGKDPEAIVRRLADDHDLQLQVIELAGAVKAPEALSAVFEWRR
jgi:hypothetical protein